MIKELSTDQQLKEKFIKEIENRRLSKFLTILRCKNNLTQKQIAEKIGCTQSRISKIETSYDADIGVNDLIDYAKALNLKLEIGFRQPSMKIVDLIKYHALKISEYLNQLVDIAKDNEDETIDKGIEDFLKETIININKISVGPYLKHQVLKNKRKKEKDTIHFSAPIDIMRESKETKILSEEKTQQI